MIDDEDEDDHDDDIIGVIPSSAPSDPRRHRASSERVVASPVAVSSSMEGDNDSGRKRGERRSLGSRYVCSRRRDAVHIEIELYTTYRYRGDEKGPPSTSRAGSESSWGAT